MKISNNLSNGMQKMSILKKIHILLKIDFDAFKNKNTNESFFKIKRSY